MVLIHCENTLRSICDSASERKGHHVKQNKTDKQCKCMIIILWRISKNLTHKKRAIWWLLDREILGKILFKVVKFQLERRKNFKRSIALNSNQNH